MSLLPVEEAKARILAGVAPTESERAPLSQALGRILAEDVAANRDQPPFAASAMDGYAVRAEDVAHPPVTLELVGEAAAGLSFGGVVGKGQTARIFTGAPLPAGADAVVIQENTARDGTRITFNKGARRNDFVRPRGLDFAAGECLLRAGTHLASREIALAAAMNHAELPVRRRPLIALLPTGDELVPPGSNPRPDQIISSNNFGLAAFVANCGGEARDLGIAADELDALRVRIENARTADVLVTLGGASVGERDLVHRALTESGMTPDFWKIAMRPGKPLMFGHLDGRRVLGLPGNPVSAFVCAHIFLRPLVDALLGMDDRRRSTAAVLGADVGANDERQDYLRARLAESGPGELIATPYPRQDSSMLRTLAEADCLVIRPPHDRRRATGEAVEILVIDI